MKFEIEPKIFILFPGMYFVVVLPELIINTDPHEEVSKYWKQAWERAGKLDLLKAQSHPNV